jgi:hypothetical protein
MPQAVSRRVVLKGASVIIARSALTVLATKPGTSAVTPPIRSTYRRMSGVIFTRTLPFYDDAVVKLYGEFARELWRVLKAFYPCSFRKGN